MSYFFLIQLINCLICRLIFIPMFALYMKCWECFVHSYMWMLFFEWNNLRFLKCIANCWDSFPKLKQSNQRLAFVQFFYSFVFPCKSYLQIEHRVHVQCQTSRRAHVPCQTSRRCACAVPDISCARAVVQCQTSGRCILCAEHCLQQLPLFTANLVSKSVCILLKKWKSRSRKGRKNLPAYRGIVNILLSCAFMT